MRLIDADAFVDKFAHIPMVQDAIRKVMDTMPSVDAMEVVRCKDCKWGKEVCGNIECFVDRNIPPEYHGYDWYCPNGERRTDE